MNQYYKKIGGMKNLPDIKESTEKGRAIYRKFQNKFKEKRGKIVAIEIESSDFFIGGDELEAAQKARSKFPYKIFVFFRIGYPAAHKIRSRCLL